MSTSIENDNLIEKKYKNYFFVDYENVNRDGLNGITKLTEEDCVRIYYSKSADTLSFGLHRRINESKAFFQYILVQIPIKNAVDCQILFDLRELVINNRDAKYYIVSNDSDFDKPIEEFKKHNNEVSKVSEICKRISTPINNVSSKSINPKGSVVKNSEKNNKVIECKTKNTVASKRRISEKEKQIRALFNLCFKEAKYIARKEEIIKIIVNGKSRQQVNNALTKAFQNEEAGIIYKRFQPLICKLPGK